MLLRLQLTQKEQTEDSEVRNGDIKRILGINTIKFRESIQEVVEFSEIR